MVLSSVDPNLPSSASSHAATPKDKKDFREWTFPRTSSISSQSTQNTSTVTSTPQRDGSQNQSSGAAVVHAHSSSVSPIRARDNTRVRRDSKFTSKDFRHRTNASLVASPSSVPISLPLSSTGPVSTSPAKITSNTSSSSLRGPSVLQYPAPTPSLTASAHPLNLSKMVYSNIRRRSASDLLYTLIFGGCLVVFALALTGKGHSTALNHRTESAEPRHVEHFAQQDAKPIDVKIPDAFLPLKEDPAQAANDVDDVADQDATTDGEQMDETEPDVDATDLISDDDTADEEQVSDVDDQSGDSSFSQDEAVNDPEEEGDAVEDGDNLAEALVDVEDVPEGEGDPASVPADEDLIDNDEADVEEEEAEAPTKVSTYEEEVAVARKRALERRQRIRGQAGSNAGNAAAAVVQKAQAGRARMLKKARLLV